MEGSETSTVFRLEPDIKTDPGGLRTLHHVWWAARGVWGITHFRDLLYWGKISPHDYRILLSAREFMQGLRLGLQHKTGRRQDTLRFDLQDAVGESLGFDAPDSTKGAGDALLAAYYRHAKALKAAATRIQERCAQELATSLRRHRKSVPKERLDGFLLIGYRKGDHKKLVIEKGNDPACRDALSFFKAVIQAWASMRPDNEDEPDIE